MAKCPTRDLQKYAAQRKLELPMYSDTFVHCRNTQRWEACFNLGKLECKGRGQNKKMARSNAAESMLRQLGYKRVQTNRSSASQRQPPKSETDTINRARANLELREKDLARKREDLERRERELERSEMEFAKKKAVNRKRAKELEESFNDVDGKYKKEFKKLASMKAELEEREKRVSEREKNLDGDKE